MQRKGRYHVACVGDDDTVIEPRPWLKRACAHL